METKVVKAESIAEAVRITKKLNCRFLAGGTDIVLALKRTMKLEYLVDIENIAELKGIKKTGSHLFIGALTKIEELRNQLVKKYAPSLFSMIDFFATPQIRNMATIGGNLANASAAADGVCALIADNAVAVIYDGVKKYELPVERIPLAPKKTILKNHEIIIGFKIPLESKYGVFMKVAPRENTGISKCAVAIGYNGRYRVGINAVAPKVLRAYKTEEILNAGGSIDDVVKALESEISPITDIRSTRAYRMHIARVLLKRCIIKIWKQKK